MQWFSCMWSVVPFTPGDDISQGVVITYVDVLLIAGWQHHLGATSSSVTSQSTSFITSENGFEEVSHTTQR